MPSARRACLGSSKPPPSNRRPFLASKNPRRAVGEDFRLPKTGAEQSAARSGLYENHAEQSAAIFRSKKSSPSARQTFFAPKNRRRLSFFAIPHHFDGKHRDNAPKTMQNHPPHGASPHDPLRPIVPSSQPPIVLVLVVVLVLVFIPSSSSSKNLTRRIRGRERRTRTMVWMPHPPRFQPLETETPTFSNAWKNQRVSFPILGNPAPAPPANATGQAQTPPLLCPALHGIEGKMKSYKQKSGMKQGVIDVRVERDSTGSLFSATLATSSSTTLGTVAFRGWHECGVSSINYSS